jgi:hypothetical protein
MNTKILGPTLTIESAWADSVYVSGVPAFRPGCARNIAVNAPTTTADIGPAHEQISLDDCHYLLPTSPKNEYTATEATRSALLARGNVTNRKRICHANESPP